MKTMFTPPPLLQQRLWACGWVAACMMLATSIGAQTLAPRINSEITSSETSALKRSLHPLAEAQFEAGPVPADTKLNGISILFKRTAAQDADLQALVAAQQNPSSPQYHQWLTPDQFAARFGMAQADLDSIQSWLQQQGFSIDSLARSKNAIRFSGTVGQANSAFSSHMLYYKVNGVQQFAASTEVSGGQHFSASTVLTMAWAIAPPSVCIRNLDDFRLVSHEVVNRNLRPAPN